MAGTTVEDLRGKARAAAKVDCDCADLAWSMAEDLSA
jgi:hypothetical protein